MHRVENLSSDTITQLLQRQAGSQLVTIYIPTHRSASPPHMSEDQIRTKNLFHKASEILKQQNDMEFAYYIAQILRELLDDREFWENQTEGLLVCIEPQSARLFHLPVDTEEYVAVDTSFHLAPVFGLLHDAQKYHLLIVSQHQPRLLTGDMYGLNDSGLKLPVSVEAALNIDESNQKSEQQRSAGGTNGNGGSYNGRGGARNLAEVDRERFWRTIDQRVRGATDAKTPLILAGVDSDVAEYRSITHHPQVLQASIAGNWSSAHSGELFNQATAIMQTELMNLDHQEAIDSYQRLHGENSDKAADKIGAIEGAAAAGRVDTLLIGSIRRTADTVRDSNAELPVISFLDNPEMNHKLHEVAQAVWQTSGTIINLEQSDKPLGNLPMVAALRY